VAAVKPRVILGIGHPFSQGPSLSPYRQKPGGAQLILYDFESGKPLLQNPLIEEAEYISLYSVHNSAEFLVAIAHETKTSIWSLHISSSGPATLSPKYQLIADRKQLRVTYPGRAFFAGKVLISIERNDLIIRNLDNGTELARSHTVGSLNMQCRRPIVFCPNNAGAPGDFKLAIATQESDNLEGFELYSFSTVTKTVTKEVLPVSWNEHG